jgi:GAF domain-containing protein
MMNDGPDVPKLLDLVQRQAKTSNELTRCTTFRDIAAVIARNMLTGGQFISINLARYDADQRYTGFEVIATANRQDAYDSQEVYESSPAEPSEALLPLLGDASAHVLIDDVPNSPVLPARMREWLGKFKVQSLFAVPLRSTTTFGFLGVNGTTGSLQFSETEIQVYQMIADQVSALVRLNRLTEESHFSQELNERLAQTLNQLTAGQDFGEMAVTIARHMLPQQGRFLILTAMDYDGHDDIAGWRVLASANRDRVLEADVAMALNWYDVNPDLRRRFRAGELFVVKEVTLLTPDAFGKPVYNWLQANQVHAVVAVPMLNDGQLIALLLLMSRSAQPFTAEEARAFQSLADQISVLFHVHTLLQQAQDTRSVVESLITANRLITTATDYSAMAQAVLYTVAKPMTAVGITVVEGSVEGEQAPVGRSLVALGANDPGWQIPLEVFDQFSLTPNQVAKLRQASPLIFEDTPSPIADLNAALNAEAAPSSAPALPADLSQQGVRWLASFGLRAGDQFIGTLEIFHVRRYTLTVQEIDAYTTLADQIGIAIRSRQLLAESRAAQALANRLVTTNREISQLAAQLNTLQDEKALFDQTCRALVTMLGVDHSRVTLLDPDGATSTVVSEYPDQGVVGAKLRAAGDPLHDFVRSTHEPVVVKDTATDPRVDPANRKVFEQLGLKSMLLIALRDAQDRYLGGVGLDIYRADRQFTPEMIDIAQTIVTQTASVFRNIRLLHDARRRAEQLQLVARFSQSAIATLGIEDLYVVALKHIAQIFPLDHISMIALDAEKNQFRAVAQYDNEEQWVDLQRDAQTASDGTIAGRILQTHQLLYIPDTQTGDLRYRLRGDLRSLVAAPIFERGTIMGMVLIGSTTPYAYSETDIAVFQQLVGQLGVSFENAEIYTQSQQLAKNKALANEISTRLQQQMDIENILRVTMNELGQAFGARRARIRLGVRSEDSQ